MTTTRTRRRWSLQRTLITAGVAVAVLAVIVIVAVVAQPGAPDRPAASTSYAVGTPGPGAEAPSFTLSSTTGGRASLSDYRGKRVLLFFHEGLGCQPCWDQIRDLEAASPQLKAAGVDQLLTITSGPVNLIAQKMSDDALTATALADSDLAVSRQYQANQYGMMGDSRDGHTFILVGPDGRIRWRADYGGAPNYTMYVSVSQLLSDMKAGASK